MTVSIGQVWTATEGQKFQVIGLVEENQHIWVYYINCDTKTEYHCYFDSFCHRFTPFTNC